MMRFVRENEVIKLFLRLARLPVSPRARCEKCPIRWAFLKTRAIGRF